jgi:multiple sugar transport system substrate-binding protein
VQSDTARYAVSQKLNLGTKYPKISQPLWTAFQAALSGSKSPQDALKAAQSTAAAATR